MEKLYLGSLSRVDLRRQCFREQGFGPWKLSGQSGWLHNTLLALIRIYHRLVQLATPQVAYQH